MDNFLKEFVGERGAQILSKAIDKIPEFKSVLIPRTVLAWVQTMGNLGYEGALPTKENSYLSLEKSENGYSGAITIKNSLYPFENADLLNVAASVGVSLDIPLEPVSDFLQQKDLTLLGKNIDLLVKKEIIRKAQQAGIKMSQHGDFHVEHTGAPQNPYVIKHTATGKVMLGNIETLNHAKAIGNWYQNKTQKAEGAPGPAASPIPAKAAGLPVKPQKRQQSGSKIQQDPNLTGGQGREVKVKITKSESERECQECGSKQFQDSEFVGCLCFSSLKSGVSSEIINNDIILTFNKSELDQDAISTLVEVLKS